MLVAAVATCGAAVWESGKRREVAERGVRAQTTITDKQVVKGSRGRKQRDVHLRFVDANSVEHTIVRSDASLWAKAIGDTTEVIYLPDDPSTVRLPDQTDASELFMLAGALAVTGAVCATVSVRGATRAVAQA